MIQKFGLLASLGSVPAVIWGPTLTAFRWSRRSRSRRAASSTRRITITIPVPPISM